MSQIFGSNNNPLDNFTLDPGKSMRMWWYGFGNSLYNVGFPCFPSLVSPSNRIVTDDHGMEWSDDHNDWLYTTDVHAEASQGNAQPADFRMWVGLLS